MGHGESNARTLLSGHWGRNYHREPIAASLRSAATKLGFPEDACTSWERVRDLRAGFFRNGRAKRIVGYETPRRPAAAGLADGVLLSRAQLRFTRHRVV